MRLDGMEDATVSDFFLSTALWKPGSAPNDMRPMPPKDCDVCNTPLPIHRPANMKRHDGVCWRTAFRLRNAKANAKRKLRRRDDR